MIDLVSPITAIAEKIPSPLPASTLGTLPGFDAALPLADIVGGDPSLLFRHVEQLEHTGTLIDDVVSSSTGPILSAGADLFSIAQDFLTYAVTRAAALGNPLTAPAAAIDVSAEALRSVAEAEQRLLVLEQELAPFAAQLESLVADSEPMATPVSSAPVDSPVFQAASMSAPASVPALPAAEPGEAAPHDSVVTAPPNSEESSGANPAGQAAVAAAKSQLGTPYVWGGSQPGGFDCSGLTSWAYGQAGVEIPRTAENQAVGRQVSFDELQAGDLAVWDGHVAMYAEDGMMIEAGDPVQMNPVRTENIGMGFQGFWRPTG
ncbi:C40 family peptidase [Corynebacterium lubricantis]|uniref:C40 family peptidase n=1 Tax=Corynebacterium lubricantis TaxID=541095 RepID=UPI00036B284F|nr:C40 family peptidase [Corynebacterium lubricantis]